VASATFETKVLKKEVLTAAYRNGTRRSNAKILMGRSRARKESANGRGMDAAAGPDGSTVSNRREVWPKIE